MKTKRTYRSVEIKQLEAARLAGLLTTLTVVIAIDVAKAKQVVAFCDAQGRCQALMHYAHPGQTQLFLELLRSLVSAGKQLQVVLEPTGTYGDVLMHQLHQTGIAVHLVSPKKTHDAQELFDGVPSQHDGKDATVIARLHAQGLSRRWEPTSEQQRTLRAVVSQREMYAQIRERLHGQLEPLLVRYWPELQGLLDVRSQQSALRFLVDFPTPDLVRTEPAQAQECLRRYSRGLLRLDKRQAVLESAQKSLGLPALPAEKELVREIAGELHRVTARIEELDGKLRQTFKTQPPLEPLVHMVGATTCAVLLSRLGDLQGYPSVGALEKACGLNLRERSSGTYQGALHITKRGPSIVRKYLFLASLRWIQTDPLAAAWYQRRSGYTELSKLRAVVALMRKLVRALFHLGRGKPYDAHLLFDTARLKPRPLKPLFGAAAVEA